MTQRKKLTLIGAGPGDEELITLKGVKALASAKVVLYDALVNKSLLDYAPEDAPKIFVGKRGGMKKCDQQEINELIVRCALQYKNVARLKGGDPCVFGRAYEEMAYAEKFDIETEIIPGVTSAVSVPASHKIPLTVRGISESFWVITGTTKDHKLSEDVRAAAQTSATIVILMGMRNLVDIVEIFQSAGKGDLPVAIIQNGTLPDERIVAGVMGNIIRKAQDNRIGSPAVIIAGEAVRHAASPTVREVFGNFSWLEEDFESIGKAV